MPDKNHPVLIDMQNQANTEELVVLNWYSWPLDELIHLVKFKQRLQFCQLLSQWFVRYALNQHPLPEAIIAMPSGHWKQFIRGYNPAAAIAQQIAKLITIPVLYEHLNVKSSFIDQRTLSRTKRLSRTKHFVAKSLPDNIRHIALVDDIITTGATMQLASKALKQQNPSLRISAWCIGATAP